MRQLFENKNWIKENFGEAELTDKRLSHRLCQISEAIANRPEGSLPQQMPKWAELKAAYRFLSNPHVTHKRIQTPHRNRVKEIANAPEKVTLYYQDTSELDYTSLSDTKGLGPIGNHCNQGMLFHSCLAVQPNKQGAHVIGLAHQQVWERKQVSHNRIETRHQRNNRAGKESAVWSKSLNAIGKPPKNCLWISVGDRASDVYEYHQKVAALKWHSVIRACQDRAIEVDGNNTTLMVWSRSLAGMGKKTIDIRRREDTVVKQIDLTVAWGKVSILPPARVGQKGHSIDLWVIRAWNEEEKLEWILLSTLPICNLADADEKIEWYGGRWIMEEYHKCLKSGCKIETRQLGTSEALEALLGILGVLAILMLQLRSVARVSPDTPASEMIPDAAIQLVRKRLDIEEEVMGVGLFWRSVARLGGFIGRKSDGDPGWQTVWKGWLRLLDMLWAVSSFSNA